MSTRIRYSEEEKLRYITEYLDSNLSITQFCNVNKIHYQTLQNWLNWYNEKKEAWQSSEISDDDLVNEVAPVFKESNGKIDDEQFHLYRKVEIKFDNFTITCDKTTFKEVWRVLNI